MARNLATADRVGRDELQEFVRPRHQGTLVTRRRDGSPQMSPVTCGLDAEGRIVVSTYPQRAKAANARRDPRGVDAGPLRRLGRPLRPGRRHRRGASTCPTRVEPLVEYFRCICGEHPDWDEYRDAMRSRTSR